MALNSKQNALLAIRRKKLDSTPKDPMDARNVTKNPPNMVKQNPLASDPLAAVSGMPGKEMFAKLRRKIRGF